MIHFMPFTYLPDARIETLTRAFGPLAVLQPLETMATPAMHAFAEQGRLNLRPCRGIDAAMLERAVRGYAAWADSHKGRGGDLASFFSFKESRASRALEESPNLIRTQIRRGGSPAPEEVIDPLLQAALFLCLAHSFDRQQDALAMDLGSVQAMEQRFGHILGEPSAEKVSLGGPLWPSVHDGPADRGLHMTAQRILAWARLALANDDADSLYLTDSRAVWDHLLDVLPDACQVCRWDHLPVAGAGSPSDDLSALFAELAAAADPLRVNLPPPVPPSGNASGSLLTVHALVGNPPHAMLARLLKVPPESRAPMPGKPVQANTLIGLLTV